MSKPDKSATLGDFLDYNYWIKAIELLSAQINLIGSNKHFNQPSMFYYLFMTRHDPVTLQKIKSKDYFDEKIANNFFYAFEKEFNVIPYNLPKGGLSLRYYKFMTYPLRVLYYAIGLYILDLTQDFLANHQITNHSIKAFYGGELKFSSEGKLGLRQENLYYLKQYRTFKKTVKSAIADRENKFVIHLDVQNYYDHISIPDLLDKITNAIGSVRREDKNFDLKAAEQIINFISYLMNYDTKGIPQMDNDIISSYLGFLYLVFSDISIFRLLNEEKAKGFFLYFEIIRYMDDMFIIIQFQNDIEFKTRLSLLNRLIFQLPDILDKELKLRLGVKNKFFNLENPQEYKELIRLLKKVSDTYEITEDDLAEEEDLDQQVEAIKKFLREYNDRPQTVFQAQDDKTLDFDILKEIYDRKIASILLKKEHQEELSAILSNFDFEKINIRPKELLALIFNSGKEQSDHSPMNVVRQNFKEWIRNKEIQHTRDAYLILIYTCQTNFSDIDTFLKLRTYIPLASIVDYLNSVEIPYSEGYYQLCKHPLN